MGRVDDFGSDRKERAGSIPTDSEKLPLLGVVLVGKHSMLLYCIDLLVFSTKVIFKRHNTWMNITGTLYSDFSK